MTRATRGDLGNEFIADSRVCLVAGVDTSGDMILTLLIKRAYRFEVGCDALEVVEPAPWVRRCLTSQLPERTARVMDDDFELFPFKELTDIVVKGHVVAAGERPTRRTRASLVLGTARKDVLVFGDRRLYHGQFTEPTPFVRMPLCWSRAYGGIDPGALDLSKATSLYDCLRALLPETHPGAYPRNPVGVGWVRSENSPLFEGLALPNFEDPHQRLEPTDIVRRDAREWALAPQPQGFGWVHANWYPRSALLGVELPLAGLDSAPDAPEMSNGRLSPECIGGLEGLDVRYTNGAALGLRVPVARGGERLTFAGFMPEGEMAMCLPGAPTNVELFLRRRRLSVELALHTLQIEPDERRLTTLWGARARIGDRAGIDLREDVLAFFEGQRVEVGESPRNS